MRLQDFARIAAERPSAQVLQKPAGTWPLDRGWKRKAEKEPGACAPGSVLRRDAPY
jgi:hypothetical protein